ncbi:helix-turn-helix domain-containing protein [Asticcacaulis sp. SL142]|uniref:helix-turn-helix domain-containing protein n=1 Tax=Asticcacaulis sp. SL142 TaxID=2995155 RepID=UPI003B63C4B2
MEILSRKLKERAEALGISNAQAAKLCGLDGRTYGHYVSGRSRPNYENLLKISNALGTSPNLLLGFHTDPTSAEIAQLVETCRNLSAEQLRMLVSIAELTRKNGP